MWRLVCRSFSVLASDAHAVKREKFTWLGMGTSEKSFSVRINSLFLLLQHILSIQHRIATYYNYKLDVYDYSQGDVAQPRCAVYWNFNSIERLMGEMPLLLLLRQRCASRAITNQAATQLDWVSWTGGTRPLSVFLSNSRAVDCGATMLPFPVSSSPSSLSSLISVCNRWPLWNWLSSSILLFPYSFFPFPIVLSRNHICRNYCLCAVSLVCQSYWSLWRRW